MVIAGLSGFVSSASATAAAATLSAAGKASAELAGTAAVLASIASAWVNLPLLARRLPEKKLLSQLAGATAAQAALGIMVLALQHWVPAFRW